LAGGRAIHIMRTNLIFDASVLVTAYLSGNIFKTGIYRVTYEILCGIIQSGEYNLYLFDIYGRERELRKFVVPNFEHVDVLPVDSKLYKTFVYPLFNFADFLRIKEHQSERIYLKFITRFCKNCFQTFAKGFRYIERKRALTCTSIHFSSGDMYFSTFNAIPLNIAFFSHLRKAIVIHDLIPILHPAYFYDHDNKHILETIIESISDNDIVFCVSKSTRRDFLAYKPLFNPNKVFVSYLAGSDCFKPNLSVKTEKIVKEKLNIPYGKSYFLSVCTIEPRKNIGLLISAYENLLIQSAENDVPLLVLTGPIGWESQSFFDNINRINYVYHNTIILTDFVSDEELAVLYTYALAFVYPSLYEGFGLPPLEAMQCGSPVITSDNSSLQEVVGTAGILIDAQDEDAMLGALKTCLSAEKVLEMRKKSLNRAELFSWDKTVENILNSLRHANC
jgi:glycosyltransferase involved in cell wall biosynthesis